MNQINPEENKDPMYPETGQNNEGDIVSEGDLPEGASVAPDAINNTPEELTPKTEPEGMKPKTEPEGSVSDDISRKLSGEGEKKEEGDGTTHPKTPLPFNFDDLTKEQLQSLKALLDSTPDARARKIENPRVRLRKINGKIIEDFKNAVNALVEDYENQRKVYRHIIPVRFFGETEYTNMPYDEFINAEQVECEVVSQRKETKEIIIGVVFSRELGRNVEAVEKKTIKWYTVKLPDGKTVELPSKVINA